MKQNGPDTAAQKCLKAPKPPAQGDRKEDSVMQSTLPPSLVLLTFAYGKI